ncbi:MAG: hypothetical protein JSR09_05350 [Bacteroidetes bacterium]|nr:hypothetical protein [Bacteroidota bacterium]MBS1649113.1 hypothetical protein [Bacteroidota bacterium]
MLTIEKKSLKVGKRVNTAHVDKVIKNYKQERWAHNSERLGKEDSLSAWWSIEEIEEFIAEAKSHNADGIKFYFAAYDETTTQTPEYVGLQTLVMVGTKQKQNIDGTTKNKDVYVQTEKGNEIVAYNMGRLCPPFCGSANPVPPSPSTGIDDGGDIGITIIDRGDKGMIVI